MDGRAIVALTSAHGVKLTAYNSRVIARPASALTNELRHAIRAHKLELIRFLAHDNRFASIDPHAVSNRRSDDGKRQQASVLLSIEFAE